MLPSVNDFAVALTARAVSIDRRAAAWHIRRHTNGLGVVFAIGRPSARALKRRIRCSSLVTYHRCWAVALPACVSAFPMHAHRPAPHARVPDLRTRRSFDDDLPHARPSKLEEIMKKLAFVLFMTFTALVLQAATAPAQGTVPDHLFCYKMQDPLQISTAVDMLAELQPEFSQKGCVLKKAVQFCVPAVKANAIPAPPNPNIVGQPLQDDYICYKATCPDSVRPASKVVTDQFGQRLEKQFQPVTVCVPAKKTPLGCPVGSTTAATCGGACPPPGRCHFDGKTKECECVDTPAPPCGKPDKFGVCGGDCSSKQGTACLPTVSAKGAHICDCLPLPPPGCGLDPATGTCGGTCPKPTDKCALDSAGQCTCQNVTPPCSKNAAGACGGSCPFAGQQCTLDSTNACSCSPPQSCGQNPLTGTCGGDCLNTGEQCVLNADGECECQPPPCGSNSNGVCGGTCPLPGQNCRLDATGACNCQPPPPCGQTGPNTCGGTCQAGTTCKLLTGAAGCACQ